MAHNGARLWPRVACIPPLLAVVYASALVARGLAGKVSDGGYAAGSGSALPVAAMAAACAVAAMAAWAAFLVADTSGSGRLWTALWRRAQAHAAARSDVVFAAMATVSIAAIASVHASAYLCGPPGSPACPGALWAVPAGILGYLAWIAARRRPRGRIPGAGELRMNRADALLAALIGSAAAAAALS